MDQASKLRNELRRLADAVEDAEDSGDWHDIVKDLESASGLAREIEEHVTEDEGEEKP